jgi:membrane-associated phospholipid phosphatase
MSRRRQSTRRWSKASTDAPRPRLLALVAGVLLGLFVVLLIAVAAAWDPILRFDDWLGHGMVGRPDWLVSPADSLGLATRDLGTGAVVAVAVALLWRPHRLWAQWLLWSAIGGFALQNIVKELIGRARPAWSESAFVPLTAAFPSGHSMSGITTWVVLGLVLLFAPVGGRLPRVIGVLALAVGVLMGPSRLVLGVHWPTDILGGWLLGGAVVCGVAALVVARSGSAGDARRT